MTKQIAKTDLTLELPEGKALSISFRIFGLDEYDIEVEGLPLSFFNSYIQCEASKRVQAIVEHFRHVS